MEPLNNCEDVDSLGRALDKYWVYKRVFETAIQGEQMSVDDAFYLNEVRLLEGGFDSQFHLACYYCYCHLKLRVHRAEAAWQDREVHPHLQPQRGVETRKARHLRRLRGCSFQLFVANRFICIVVVQVFATIQSRCYAGNWHDS